MTSFDPHALQDGAESNALRQRGQQRTAGEGDVPAIALPAGSPAEFERHAAKHQAEQHSDHRGVQRGHQHGIGQRKRREHPAAAEHQPGLVAVPHRRHTVHDDIAVGLVRKQRKQQAEAKVEAVHHHIDEDGKGDDEGPDGGDVDAAGHDLAP